MRPRGAFTPKNSQFEFGNFENLRVISIFQKKRSELYSPIKISSQTPTYKGDPLIQSFL